MGDIFSGLFLFNKRKAWFSIHIIDRDMGTQEVLDDRTDDIWKKKDELMLGTKLGQTQTQANNK